MDPKRQGEIAIKLLKHLMQKEGVTLSSAEDVLERTEKAAQMTGISVDELLEFAKPLVHEFVDECFPDNSDKPKPGIPLGQVFADADEETKRNAEDLLGGEKASEISAHQEP